MGQSKSELQSIDEALGEEYENEPVPPEARKSTFAVSVVTTGYPLIITASITGGVLTLSMGFTRALTAILIGQGLVFLYVMAMGLLGQRSGLNFGQIAASVFGTYGRIFTSGLLSLILLGWFAVQTGMAGALLASSYNIPYLLITLIAGILFIALAFIGVRGLELIGLLSTPLFIGLSIWAVTEVSIASSWGQIAAFQGTDPQTSMLFGVGITAIFGLFGDVVTVWPDFTRWSKNRTAAIIASAAAFPLANLFSLISGAIFVAALGNPEADLFGQENIFGYATGHQAFFLGIIAFIFLLSNLGSVCSHCLYNSAQGWAAILNIKFRHTVAILGVIGLGVSMANIWEHFIPWLETIAIVEAPMGAVVIADRYLIRRDLVVEGNWGGEALGSWAIGVAVAFIVHFYQPALSAVVSGFVVAVLAYWVIARVFGFRRAYES